ncbi:reverse transcriptase [Gossypium australe]|uniref:Reverse transcriptase n=1 Tax=Gossypium australe TaxID=47621 RepID=A0A5B6V9D8_9ROSI|nr:reverse transcriptase [Gossypium australe]
MEGRPWLFRKYLILFDRLLNPVERDHIRLSSSPYWIKIASCPPEYDKKDLLHAIGSTFRGVLRSKITDDVCRLRVNLDVQKPLRREQDGKEDDTSIAAKGILLGGKILASWEEGLKEQVDSREEADLNTSKENNNKGESSLKELKRPTWKRILSTNHSDHQKFVNAGVKRKGLAEESGQENMEVESAVGISLSKWAHTIKGKKGEIRKRLTKELEILMKEDRDDETLDRNTTNFHNCASARRRVIIISKLILDDGKEINDASVIHDEAKLYFEKLFNTNGVANPREVLEGIEESISIEANEYLLAPFSEDEVKTTLKGMGPIKAPGPDGFPAIFFQKYWHIVGKEVLGFCLRVLNEGKEVDSVNMTNIVLIPKVQNPTSLVNFRPISLCSVLYKLVAKTIANRMQNVMDTCIDQVQSAFVPGRVEWDFIKEVMNKMGFARKWIELIMKCITSVSYTVLINGSRGRIFNPSGGLRQGDPLSPFLFLICSEGLSALMRTAKKNGLLRGAKASRKGLEISHLLFADDCMMFGEATEKGARVLKDLLNTYERCSGQCVNFGKSTIFYSTNTTEGSKAAVGRLLGVRSSSSPKKYLGLPNMVGRQKKEAFQNLVDRIASRIERWSSRLLSQGGKEVFIKSVLQAIPTHAMSCFLFPRVLCEKIESILARFWWQKGPGKRGIHWCQWRFLCRSKEEGGLGFRRMAQFNISLLAKQGWRLLNFLNSLVARAFKAKYFPNTNFLHLRLGSLCSYIWRNIWATKGTLEKGLLWKVGTGSNISISQDTWIPDYVNGRLLSSFDNLQCDKVAELISSNETEWNKELIVNTFPADVAELILRIPLSMEPHEEFLAWSGEPMGVFSVRSSYKLLQRLDPTAYALHNIYKDFYRRLWQIEIPSKMKIFIWKISWNYIASKVNMYNRRLVNNILCPRCGGDDEMLNHLFRECPVSAEIWRMLPEVNLTGFTNNEFSDWLTMVVASLSLEKSRTFCIALWSIWGDRNSRIHEKSNRSSREIVRFIYSYIQDLEGIRTNISKNLSVNRKWRNPPATRLKINFDGRRNISADRVVVRDSSGNILLSSADIHKGVHTTFAAEALAYRRATQIALNMKEEDMIIEGDSLTVIKKCQSTVQDKSQINTYIYDIRSMKSSMRSLTYVFTLRSANRLAHVLPVESLRREEGFYLLHRVPDFAEGQARRDSEREPD